MIETSLERLRAMLDAMPNLVLLINPYGEIEAVGERGAARLGYTSNEIRSRSARELIHPDDHHRLVAAKAALDAGREDRFEIRVLNAAGEPHLYLVTQRQFDDDRILVSATESAAVTDSDSRFSDLMKLADLTDDIFMVTDRDGFILYINGAASATLGARRFVGEHIGDFVDSDGWEVIADRIRSGEQQIHARVATSHVSGGTIPLELSARFDEETQHWYTVMRDITALVRNEQRMQSLNARLRRQATTDALTGVANRVAFAEAVEHAIFFDDPFSVLLLDMDDFKSVNDTLGHGVGDEFLRVLARRLQATVALQDLVARLGGDEFVVFVPQLGPSDAAALATRILDAMSAPFQIGEHNLSRSCSIGGATWAPGDSFSDVLRKADQAAYKAKHAGRSRFAMHEGPSNAFPSRTSRTGGYAATGPTSAE